MSKPFVCSANDHVSEPNDLYLEALPAAA